MLASAVDQYRKLYLFWPAKIHQLVHCGPNRSACIKNVIHQNDDLVFDIGVELCAINDRICSDCRKVVSVKRDVEDAVERTFPFELCDLIRESLGERHSASSNAHEVKVFRTLIVLYDLVRKLPQLPAGHMMSVDEESAGVALRVLDYLANFEGRLPSVFTHGGDAIVLKWDEGDVGRARRRQ